MRKRGTGKSYVHSACSTGPERDHHEHHWQSTSDPGTADLATSGCSPGDIATLAAIYPRTECSGVGAKGAANPQ